MDKDNSATMQLYFEFNGTRYAVDPKCCVLDFSAHQTAKDSTATLCLEITAEGAHVCLDLISDQKS